MYLPRVLLPEFRYDMTVALELATVSLDALHDEPAGGGGAGPRVGVPPLNPSPRASVANGYHRHHAAAMTAASASAGAVAVRARRIARATCDGVHVDYAYYARDESYEVVADMPRPIDRGRGRMGTNFPDYYGS